ncbi:unnamed protein product [Brassica napus]|uniref:(rape) hypothetical protein n=1 Tax=Brassica napus TaxID=3708 RepID=A0A816IC39_BRANA|nr:unnamed protein product [Brassica napus]
MNLLIPTCRKVEFGYLVMRQCVQLKETTRRTTRIVVYAYCKDLKPCKEKIKHKHIVDVVGHMKLVNGQTLIKRPILDETEISTSVMVHLQSHEYVLPAIRITTFLYCTYPAATEFFKKFMAYENTPTVLLVTTVNPKRLGGTLALSSMSSSRGFMNYDVQPTIDYFNWMGSKPEIQELVNAEVVTKAETMTIAEIYAYIKHESAKLFFECIATIDDVGRDSAWYYIACSGCHTKAIKGPTSLMCPKCGNDNVAGVPQYRAKISVYNNNEQAVFVLLGDTGRELTGKHATKGSQGRSCSSYGFWVGDGSIDEAAEEASAQKKRVSLQRQAAVTVEAAEDYAQIFESGVNVVGEELAQSGVNVMCKTCFLGESQGSERARRMLSSKSCGKKYNKNCVKSWAQHIDFFHWSSWSCPSCRVCEIPNGLLQDCKSQQNLSLHNNPISMDEFRLANQNLGADHQIPVPESLINTIGQTHKFSVKVSDHNLTEKTETITITKIPSPVVLPAGTASVENHVALTSEADGDHASERNKSTCHSE